jgi:hypothetical protein
MTAPELAGITWRTSSYSANGGTCVEVGWRKSSYSANGGDCVEVGWPVEGVAVRDSKHPTGPMLTIPTDEWHRLLHAVRR